MAGKIIGAAPVVDQKGPLNLFHPGGSPAINLFVYNASDVNLNIKRGPQNDAILAPSGFCEYPVTADTDLYIQREDGSLDQIWSAFYVMISIP